MLDKLKQMDRTRVILIAIIAISLLCYLFGMLLLWSATAGKGTATPTETATNGLTETPFTTFTLPALSPTVTQTPTATRTFTPTITYVIPLTITPTLTPSRTATTAPTATQTPVPTDTDIPVPEATFTQSFTPSHTPTTPVP
jgi:hypothetical protein